MQGQPDKLDSFDWDRLRVFRSVALSGSMSAAAEKIGGSLPTVSRRMADLEAALHTELFKRSPRGIQLTDAGHILLRHVELMADTVEAAQDEVSVSAGDMPRLIHMTCCEAIASWIVPRIARFQTDNPDIHLDLTVSDSPTAMDDFGADICIQHTRPQHSDLIVKRLGRSHYMAFVSSEYAVSRTPPASFSSLLSTGCLAHSAYLKLARSSPQLGTGLDLLRGMSSFTTLLSYCQSGFAPALLPTHIQDITPDLTIWNSTPGLALDIWMVSTRRLRKIKSGSFLVDWLSDTFSREKSNWFRQTLQT